MSSDKGTLLHRWLNNIRLKANCVNTIIKSEKI